MKTLYILCGIPGSGKSTFARESLKKLRGSTAIVSRDEIRFSLVKENEDYFSKEKEVFRHFIEEIKTELSFKDNVIVDATHLNINSRTKLLRALSGEILKDVYVFAVYFNVPLEVCLNRNSKRTGRKFVPEDKIKTMFKSFTKPSFEEGFDEIIQIDENGKITYFL